MADRDTPARRPAGKKTTKRTAAKRSSSARGSGTRSSARRPVRRDPVETEEQVEELDLGTDDLDDDAPPARSSRPVAVGGPPSFLADPLDDDDDGDDGLAAFAEPDDDEADADQPEQAFDSLAPALATTSGVGVDEIERPWHELAAGSLGAVLAVLAFIPWYRGPLDDPSGWSSGTFGPVVFALGLIAAAIVGLRRLGVGLRFPVHHSLVLEGIGWVATLMLLVKLNFAPRIAGNELAATWNLRGALIAALALSLVGSSVSQGVALVVRPGWFADNAGKLGAGVLVLPLLVGGVFAFTNDAGFSGFASNPDAEPLDQGYPQCAKAVGFPLPERMTPGVGGPQAVHCFATLTTSLGANKTLAAYAKELRLAEWSIIYDSRKDKLSQFPQLQAKRGRECGTVTVIAGDNEQNRKTQVTVLIGPPDTLCNLKDKLRDQQDGR